MGALPGCWDCGAVALGPMSLLELGQVPVPLSHGAGAASHLLHPSRGLAGPATPAPVATRCWGSGHGSAPAPSLRGTQPFPGSGCASHPWLFACLEPHSNRSGTGSPGRPRSHPQHDAEWGYLQACHRLHQQQGLSRELLPVPGAAPGPALRGAADGSAGAVCRKDGGTGAAGAFPAGSLPGAPVPGRGRRALACSAGQAACTHVCMCVCTCM